MLSGASFTDAFLASGFTTVSYRGAFGTTDWTAGWANFRPDTNAYTSGIFPVGLAEHKAEVVDMQVYPNPASDQLTVAFTLKQGAQVRVVLSDVFGNTLQEQSLQANRGFQTVRFGTQPLPSGFYLVRVLGANATGAAKVQVLR